jgi:hypothetical protein
MPNWAYNNITVKGKPQEILKFIEDTKVVSKEDTNNTNTYQIDGVTYEHSLNQLFPCPTELYETKAGWFSSQEDGSKDPKQIELEAQQETNLAKYGAKDWYDWANINWDTKWGACDVRLDPDEWDETSDRFDFYCESAWSPPMGLLRKISEVYPNLVFGMSTTEESDAYACIAVFYRGVMVAEKECDPNPPDDSEEGLLWEQLAEDCNYDELYDRQSEWRGEMLFNLDEELESCMDMVYTSLKMSYA